MAKKRLIGIDVMKSLSMFMVVALHMIFHGGLLQVDFSDAASLGVTCGLESLCIGAVDCFAIASGFLCYGARNRYGRLVSLWLKVVFWSVLITLVLFMVDVIPFSAQTLALSFFPVLTGSYWYISSYVGLFVLIPVLNAAVYALDGRKTFFAIAPLFIVFSLLGFLTLNDDPFGLVRGYSTLWLAFLYLLGAMIRKFEIAPRISCRLAWGGFFAGTLLTFGLSLALVPLWTGPLGKTGVPTPFISYNSPTVLLSALCLFLAMTKLRLHKGLPRQFALLMGAVSLDVYLIHDHPLVREYVMSGAFKGLAASSPLVIAGTIIGGAFLIWLACSLAGMLRVWLFKVFHMSALAAKADRGIYNLINKSEAFIWHKFLSNRNSR